MGVLIPTPQEISKSLSRAMREVKALKSLMRLSENVYDAGGIGSTESEELTSTRLITALMAARKAGNSEEEMLVRESLEARGMCIRFADEETR